MHGQNTSSERFQCEFDKYHIISTVIVLAIWTANSIVLAMFVKNRSLREPAVNHLLFSLSLEDTLNAVGLSLVVLFYFICDVSKIGTYALAGETLNNLCSLVAVGHLVLLSTDRTISLQYALRYNDIVRKSRVHWTLALVWIFSIVISTLHISWYHSVDRDLYDRIFAIVFLIVFALLPAILMISQYTYMYLMVKELLRNSPVTPHTLRKKKEVRALLIYCLMFLCFVVLSFPYFTVRVVMEYIPYNSIPSDLLSILMLMRFGVSIVNPMLYTLLKIDFRKTLKSMFGCVDDSRSRLIIMDAHYTKVPRYRYPAGLLVKICPTKTKKVNYAHADVLI